MKRFPLTPFKILTWALGLAALVLVAYPSKADLVNRYSFNDATTSTNCIDSVGGQTGSLYPGASYPGDGTVTLDGVSGFVYLPNDIVSNLTSCSFEVWTTPTVNSTWARLFDFGNNQGGPGTGGAGGTGGSGTSWTYVSLDDGSGLFRGDVDSSAGESIVQGPSPAAGIYHDVVLTIDAVNKIGALYDNGVQVSVLHNFTITPRSVGHTFNDYIGRSQFGDPYYTGSIDEFRIYNTNLFPQQIEADYESGAATTSDTPGALQTLSFNNPSNVVLGAIFTPVLQGTFASITNPANLTILPGIVYTSDQTNIVSFGTDGNFHANSSGAATIHATYQSQTATLTVTVAPQPVILEHRYSFDGPSTSTTITDSVGGATGTLVNQSPTAELTGSGQLALDGNASSGYVSLPSGILPQLTNATFQVWLNWSGGGVWQEIYSLGSNYNGGGQAYTTLIPANGANNKLRWGINEGGEVDIDGQSELVTNQEVVVTVAYNYSAQTANIYLNSRKVGSGAMSKALYTIPDVDNYLGQSQFASDPHYQGTLDEFRIYSGVESDLQIAIDATVGPNSIVTNPGPLQSITVSATNSVDVHGLPAAVKVAANFANVTNVDIATLPAVTLSSSDTSVATIVNGNIVPKNAGSTTITASYGGLTGSLAVNVVDTGVWPTLIHHWGFNDAAGSTTFVDSIGGINGTLQGLAALNGSALTMPAGNPPPNNGQPTAASGWASFPPNEGLVTSLPNEASFEIWVYWAGGNVWQEMFDFGQAATQGVSSGGGQYVMICPHDGASGSLRAEWDQNGGSPAYDFVLTAAPLQPGTMDQVVWTHDQDRQLDKLYCNGVQVANGVNTGVWNTLPDTDNWMARDEWPDPMFNGSYLDFRIWNGALTDGQVANLYAAGAKVVAGPALVVAPAAGGSISLSWPANASNFTLQSATTLTSPAWTAVAGTPVVANGVNTLTVPGGQSQIYYRLKD